MSIFLLFIMLFSVILIYIYFNLSTTEEKQYNGSNETISDEDILNEIDQIFLDEDSEIEIGEMV